MLPFQMEAEPDFEVGDYIYVPGVRKALDGDLNSIKAYVLGNGKDVKAQIKELDLYITDMTPEERAIDSELAKVLTSPKLCHSPKDISSALSYLCCLI